MVNDPVTGSVGTAWPNAEVKPDALNVTRSLTRAALAACAPTATLPATNALNNKIDLMEVPSRCVERRQGESWLNARMTFFPYCADEVEIRTIRVVEFVARR